MDKPEYRPCHTKEIFKAHTTNLNDQLGAMLDEWITTAPMSNLRDVESKMLTTHTKYLPGNLHIISPKMSFDLSWALIWKTWTDLILKRIDIEEQKGDDDGFIRRTRK